MSKIGHLNPNIPAPDLAQLLTAAAGKMKAYNLRLLTPQLLLRVMLEETQSPPYQLLQRLAKQRGFDWDDLVRRVEMMTRNSIGREANFLFTDDFGKDVPLADEMLVMIDEGLTIAQSRDELKVTSGHALAAMAGSKVTTFGVLQRIGVTQAIVLELLEKSDQVGEVLLTDFVEEAKKGNGEPIFERRELMREMLALLATANKRHIILVGQEGSGKRTLARSLALWIAEGKVSDLRSLVQINESALLEDPLAAVRAGLRRASKGVLIVPEIGRFFPTRTHPSAFPAQVCRELQKAILGNEHVVIGTATISEFERFAQERLIRERTHRLDVPPTTINDTVAILNFHRPNLEQEYKQTIQREALDKAAQLAAQYLKTTALPSAALQLLNRACALVKMAGEGHLSELGVSADSQLSPEDVMVATSIMAKVPVNKLSADESSRYANMVEHLGERIIGQEEAVMAVSRAVKIARVGLRDPKRPIGSFLFLGPSGVGKSELAKALADFMFGTEEAMCVLDMSEYQEEASVNRMIGSPPGYVGYESGGQLTDFVRERPYTVVLLDEIEKAHPRVLDVLLQVLEEGRLTDSQGRVATFGETVVIMTSNIGAKEMMVPVIGERERELVMEEVFDFLRPEFVNRIDEVILFHQLTPEQLAQILDILLKKELKMAAAQGLNVRVTEEAKIWLLAQNSQPEFGARPLRRILAKHLREPLADFLLTHAEAKNQEIVVSAENNRLTFR